MDKMRGSVACFVLTVCFKWISSIVPVFRQMGHQAEVTHGVQGIGDLALFLLYAQHMLD